MNGQPTERITPPVRLLPLFFLLLPFIEIAGFVLVGKAIGVLPTLGLVLASAVIGVLLLRAQGLGALARARAEIEADGDPGRQIAHGAMIVVAAILLIIPGFFTDLIGLLLFLPPVRDLAWRRLRGRVFVAGGFRPGSGGAARRGRTIDLDEDDFSREHANSDKPRGPSPWKQIDHD